MSAYAGFPAAVNGLSAAKEVFKEGIKMEKTKISNGEK
jgi:alkylhydroperoxidase/carboxymuconolactone decarboxylase family protein YurZ